MKGLMGILQSWKNQSESWKSPGNLFLKKGTNPVIIISGFFIVFILSYMSLGIELDSSVSKPKCHVIHHLSSTSNKNIVLGTTVLASYFPISG